MNCATLRRLAKRVVEKNQRCNKEMYVVYSEEVADRLESENPYALVVFIKRFSDDCQAR